MDPRAGVEPRNRCNGFTSASPVHEVFHPLDVFGFASAQPPGPLPPMCRSDDMCPLPERVRCLGILFLVGLNYPMMPESDSFHSS